jgi:hypothetical protein
LVTPLSPLKLEKSLLTPAPPLFGQISPDKNIPLGNLKVGDANPSDAGTSGGGVGKDKGNLNDFECTQAQEEEDPCFCDPDCIPFGDEDLDEDEEKTDEEETEEEEPEGEPVG